LVPLRTKLARLYGNSILAKAKLSSTQLTTWAFYVLIGTADRPDEVAGLLYIKSSDHVGRCAKASARPSHTQRKIQISLVAIGGVNGVGAKVGAMVRLVAAAVWLGPQFQSDL